jgi:Uma2 family endonuclease
MGNPPANDDRLLTIAEFEQLPEEDGYRIELVRGRLVRSRGPASLHGVLAARLVHRLVEFVEEGGHGVMLAGAGVVLARNPDTVRIPDAAFFSKQRIPETGYAATYWGPPDLAVEITSPSNRVSEMHEKVTDYTDAGVRVVWVVDPPTRTIFVYQSAGAARMLRHHDVLEGDDVLPEFRLPLAAFFTL